ncbi:MAG TPA: imidazole glycerol phosphate synthase subunit HisH [Acidimicrobiales bacterium]|nr:imidazole glycerol phosphate synthase subunit HisH [Acidimicrobiales bacterium]
MIAVLDYGIGNLRSAQKALERVGADARLTADPADVATADGVVLPGVGAFGRCMQALRAAGLEGPARDAIERSVPFLGICVGMQMLYEGSDEDPETPGMGVLGGWVRRLPDGVKRPQMQWNRLDRRADSPLLAGLGDPAWVYFVHSFAPEPTPEVVATCDYGGPVVAAVQRRTLWATQFHPEKSSAAGLRLLANFMAAAGGPG